MNRLAWGICLFLVLFVALLATALQGVDVTDQGYNLTNQVHAVSGVARDAHPPMTFLTDYVGGWWLLLAGGPSLLWARAGYPLLTALTAVAAYAVLARQFAPCRVFVAVLVSAFFITIREFRYIHYFSFPALLLTVELLAIDRMLEAPPETRSFRIWALLAGFLPVPAVLGRFSLVLFGFAPAVVFGWWLFARRSTDRLKRAVPWIGLGLVLSCAVFGALYASIGYLDTYAEGLRAQLLGMAGAGHVGGAETGSATGHGITGLAKMYLRQYGHVGLYAGGIALGLFALSLLRDRVGIQAVAGLLVLLTAAGCAFKFVRFDFARSAPGLMGAYKPAKLGMAGVFLVAGLFYWHDPRRSGRLGLLLLLGLFVMVITPLGSNTGLNKSLYGMWIVLPLALLLVGELRDRGRGPRLRSMLALRGAVVAALVVFCAFMHYTNTYRDIQNRVVLDTPLRYRGLRGMYTHEARADVLDPALARIDALTEPGDEILCVGHIPLFYYLTETRPFLGHVWLSLRTIPAIEEAFDQKVNIDGRLPALFVVARVDPVSYSWPDGRAGDGWPGMLRRCELLRRRLVQERGYRLVFENRAFAVYRNPELVGRRP
ncbi:MAG: hypothetical protein ACOC70_00405 [bacterium]